MNALALNYTVGPEAELGRFRPGFHPDVHPQFSDLRSLPALLGLLEVNGLLPHNTADVPFRSEYSHALAHEYLWIPSTNSIDVEETLLVDVCDLEADLIDVTGKHDAWPRLGVDGREGVPADVRFDMFREGLSLRSPKTSRPNLESGGADSIEKTSEKWGSVTHGGTNYTLRDGAKRAGPRGVPARLVSGRGGRRNRIR